ncbi:MAG: Abi family protein [Janthinobacterium lividum]
MHYSKPALTYEQQVVLLAHRGLVCSDLGREVDWLWRIGYYRLSAYFIPFRAPGTDDFKPGTTLDQIVDLYKFDGNLRLLVMQAMDRIEIAVRGVVTYHLAHELGVFGYTDSVNFHPGYDHADLMRKLAAEERRSSELFVAHFRSKYTSEPYLPIWVATELMSFGMLSKMYGNVRKSTRKRIAKEFAQPESVFVSWLHSLAAIRNVCAHHSILWNKQLRLKPELPGAWKAQIDNRRFYVIAIMVQTLLLKVSPESKWKERLKEHFNEYPGVDLIAMGFPADWQTRAPWI